MSWNRGLVALAGGLLTFAACALAGPWLGTGLGTSAVLGVVLGAGTAAALWLAPAREPRAGERDPFGAPAVLLAAVGIALLFLGDAARTRRAGWLLVLAAAIYGGFGLVNGWLARRGKRAVR